MKFIVFTILFVFNGYLLAQNNFPIQAHRGSRTHFPENTLYAFDQSVNAGFRIIELDVVISKDHQIVVSHDPWINTTICGKGNQLLKQKKSLYNLTYEEIKTIDCGSFGHSKFPQQEKRASFKPLLSEVLAWANQKEQEIGEKLVLNIEIKSRKSWEGVYMPDYSIFCDSVLSLIEKYNRVDIVQTFDTRVLQYVHQKAPHLPLSYLVVNAQAVKKHIKKIGFSPVYYCPNYLLVKAKNVQEAHKLGLKVVPWTVNDLDIFSKLMKYKIDGVITDNPQLLRTYFIEKKFYKKKHPSKDECFKAIFERIITLILQ